MIRAVGIDIVEIARIRKDIDRYGERFIQRILGPDEAELINKRADREIFLAGRFAAKEALVKALVDTLEDRPLLAHLQIVNNASGRPIFKAPNHLEENLEKCKIHISISHERNYAVAVAIVEEVST